MDPASTSKTSSYMSALAGGRISTRRKGTRLGIFVDLGPASTSSRSKPGIMPSLSIHAATLRLSSTSPNRDRQDLRPCCGKAPNGALIPCVIAISTADDSPTGNALRTGTVHPPLRHDHRGRPHRPGSLRAGPGGEATRVSRTQTPNTTGRQALGTDEDSRRVVLVEHACLGDTVPARAGAVEPLTLSHSVVAQMPVPLPGTIVRVRGVTYHVLDRPPRFVYAAGTSEPAEIWIDVRRCDPATPVRDAV